MTLREKLIEGVIKSCECSNYSWSLDSMERIGLSEEERIALLAKLADIAFAQKDYSSATRIAELAGSEFKDQFLRRQVE